MKYKIIRTLKQKSNIDYSQELNPAQLTAVTAVDGIYLVLAGAGSGKTRTITYRTAYLIDVGVPLESILLMTFTNKAAKEMVSRVEKLIGQAVSGKLTGGTFHHVGNRLLRRYAAKLGYENNFTIIDTEDVKSLINICREETGVTKLGKKFPQASTLYGIISFAVNTQTAIEPIVLDKYPNYYQLTDQIITLAKHYQMKKRKLQLMDYDDLLLNWLILLQESPELATALGRKYRYIMVDEYQDTNTIQGAIIDKMAEAEKNLFCVGDDAQSIYAFRGANYANILRFQHRYPTSTIIKLEANYRSTPQICDLANNSIRFNTDQYYKELTAQRASGELPILAPIPDTGKQAEFVAQRILEIHEEQKIALSEIAVLYRAHYQSLEIQVELTKRGIPFIIRSGIRYFEQAHIKDILSFLRIVANPLDEVAWKRALQLFPGLGAQKAGRIWEILSGTPAPFEAFVNGSLDQFIGKKGKTELMAVVNHLRAQGSNESPTDAIKFILDIFYEEYLKQHFENPNERKQDIEQLAVFARQYRDTLSFLAELSLLGELDGVDVAEEKPENDDAVVLSTIHRAKGLEWHTVFLVWCAEGHFPSVQSYRNIADIEEERRLFYVAVTRAKDILHLCYPILNSRGDMNETILRPSRFIDELANKKYAEWTIEEEIQYVEMLPPA